jgi:hypothetical protein
MYICLTAHGAWCAFGQQSAKSARRDGMSAISLFSSTNEINRAARLDEESYSAVFGSVTVDFTRTPLEPGRYTVNALAMFGSVELIFPEDVDVRLSAMALFGSSHSKDARGVGQVAGLVEVTVEGLAAFGSIDVRRVPSRHHAEQGEAAGEIADEPRALTDSQYDAPTAAASPAYEGETRKIG